MLTYDEKLQIDERIKKLYEVIAYKELHSIIANMLSNINDFGMPVNTRHTEEFIHSWCAHILKKLEKCKEDAINTISSDEWVSRAYKKE